jgi:hypothetical protein
VNETERKAERPFMTHTEDSFPKREEGRETRKEEDSIERTPFRKRLECVSVQHKDYRKKK